MIRALIVDDEPPARARLRLLLEACGDIRVVGEAGSALDAASLMRHARPDLLFLDIEMPEMRGTTFAASLPHPRPLVVFATAYDRYAIDAFACDAVDYLLKPVSRAALGATLDRVRRRMHARSDTERDVAIASALQADMWPGAMPRIPGFDCAAASLPAAGVGGDFYDGFPLDDGTWGLLLGDVSGKGVAAGLVASAVQARVHTAARHAHLGPADLAATLNADVFASTQGQRYATLIYATLDAAARRLTLVNAGHPAALISPPGAGAIVEAGSTGPALGLFESAAFSATAWHLPAGTEVVIVSDGVLDALDATETEFGMARLLAVLASHRAATAGEVCGALLDAVRAHRGAAPPHDDVTVLVLRATDDAG
jgi:serine phosphatase RsbU (regulator of sigma subunit)